MSAQWIIGLAVLVLALGAPAQDVAWRAIGLQDTAPGGGRKLGWRTTVMDDVDLDGYGEVLTLVEPGAGSVSANFLWILSGRSGTPLLESPAPNNTYIRSFDRSGDWDGDGRGDFLCGLVEGQFAHRVEVRSGHNNSVLMSVPTFWPDEVIGGLDVDGDHLPDFVVADEHSLNYYGLVDVYNHYGQLLYRLAGGPANGNIPALGIATSICALGDVDDDGCDDFVVGCVETTGAGVNVVVSGRTGAYLHYCMGELATDALFGSLDPCGDIDGDGYDEFVAASINYAQRRCFRVFSARTGQPLLGWCMTAQRRFCIKVSSSRCDVDGDGLPDILVGTDEVLPFQQSGKVYAFSGRDGSLLHEVRSPSLPSGYGRIGLFTGMLRAPVGGHTGLFLVPDPDTEFVQGSGILGAVTAYRGLPRTATLLGTPCPGTLSTTPNAGMQSLGSSGVRIHLSDAPPNAPAILLLGLSTSQIFGTPLPLALDPLGFPGCSLRSSIEAQHLVATGATGMTEGYAAIDVPLPVPASGLGTWTVSGQWLVLGLGAEFPGGMTQAIIWRR